MEHPLVTFIRTKLVHQNRLKNLKSYTSVRIHKYELKKLNVSDHTLHRLQGKQIEFDDKGFFTVLTPGPVDFNLLNNIRKKPMTSPLTPLHHYMKEQLLLVSIDTKEELPVYFKSFLSERTSNLPMFFTVDAFSQRVHTPIVSLKSHLRKNLRLCKEKIISLDVK